MFTKKYILRQWETALLTILTLCIFTGNITVSAAAQHSFAGSDGIYSEILNSPEAAMSAMRSGSPRLKGLSPASGSETEAGQIVVADIDTALTDSFGADRVYYYSVGGYYILKYADADRAKNAAELLNGKYPYGSILQDRAVTLGELTGTDSSVPYGAEVLGLDKLKEANIWQGEAKVAVIDSGINTEHIWFKNRIDTENSVNFASDYYNDRSAYNDLGGHGTHVSGIITQNTPEQVKIMVVRVFDITGTSTILTITLGVDYAVEHDADVLNMSLGQEYVTNEETALMNAAFQRGVENGCSIFAASGNEYTDVSKSFPASSAWTIAVGSFEVSDGKYIHSDFSNTGRLLDFAAPGRDILSAWIGGADETLTASGTSMATPFMAAEAAYIKLMHPDYTQVDVYAAMQDYAVDIGDEGRDDEFGYGYVDLSEYITHDADPNIKRSQSIYANSVINTDMNHYGEKIPVGAYIGRGDGVLSYTSSDTSVAEIDGGNIVVNGAGSCDITVTASETENYYKTTKLLQLFVDKGDQVITFEKTSYDCKLEDGAFRINASLETGDGSLSFTANKNNVLTVSPDGVVTPKNTGTAKVYVTASSTKNFRMLTASPVTVTVTRTGTAGDVNDDGLINEKDAILLTRYVAGRNGIMINLKNADINGDRAVDEKDAVILVRYVAGWGGWYASYFNK